MKFQVAAMAEKAINAKGGDDSIVVLVGIPEGTFVVNYLNGTAEFFKKVGLESVVISLAKNLDTKVVVEYEFGPAQMTTKENFRGVKTYKGDSIKLYVGGKWRKLLVEYLDGKIGSHKHKFGQREVYVSTDAPFEGRVCNLGESHETFAEHTIAVKLT